MKEINGQNIIFNINQLHKVSDLIAFDGPLLSHFMNDKGDSFLFYWVDVDDNYNRWMIFRTDLSQIQNYLNKKETLYNLILECNDEYVYFVDIDDDNNYHNICYTSVKLIEDDYLPEKNSYYQFDLVDDYNLSAVSQKFNTGILELKITGKNVGYGSIPLDKLAYIIPQIEEIRKAMSSKFINRRKKALSTDADKRQVQTKILKQETQYEFIYSRAGSFSMIFRPITQQTTIPNIRTISDEFAEDFVELFNSGFDKENIENFSLNYDKNLIQKYFDLIYFMNENELGIDIEWMNNQSKTNFNKNIKPNETVEILKNLSDFKYTGEEQIKYKGRFYALNTRSGTYSFESTEGDDFKSNGYFDQNRKAMSITIKFNSEYEVVINRKSSEKIGGKEKIKDTIISFFEIPAKQHN